MKEQTLLKIKKKKKVAGGEMCSYEEEEEEELGREHGEEYREEEFEKVSLEVKLH